MDIYIKLLVFLVIMIIIAPVAEKSTEVKCSARFARANYFAIIDVDSEQITIEENQFANETHGAGSKALNWMVKKGATAVIADQLGPTAVQIVDANPNLKAYLSGGLLVNQIAAAYKNNQLTEYPAGEVRSAGHGGGRGRGRN